MQHGSGIELAPAPLQSATVWDIEQQIIVRLAGVSYAVPLSSIQEVEHVPAITPVPFSTPWVRGVVNLRGTVLTLVDLCALLDLGAWQAGRDARMLIVRENEPVAVAVDALLGMRRLPVTEMTAIEGTLAGRVADYLIGLHRGDDEMFGVLDLPRLLQDAGAEAMRATTTALRSSFVPHF